MHPVLRRSALRLGPVLALLAAVALLASPVTGTPVHGTTVDVAGVRGRADAGRHEGLASSPALPSQALYGWGDNDSGQVGVGSIGGGAATGVTLPTVIHAPSGVVFRTVAAGGAFTDGLTPGGQVYAWGTDSLGQLGNGSTDGQTTPEPVSLPGSTVTAVAAGSAHTLALTSTGALYAWGANTLGQLGTGTSASSTSPVPVATPAGVTFTAVAAGGDDSLALSSTGVVYAWGANGHGQLGDGTTFGSATPVAVAPPPG